MTEDSIYKSRQTLMTTPLTSISSYDRLDIDDDAIFDMDVYRHWGSFTMRDEPLFSVWSRRREDGSIEYYLPEVTENGREGGKVKEPKVELKKEEIFYTDSSNISVGGKKPPRIGVRSLFNAVHAVSQTTNYMVHMNTPLIDGQEVRKKMRDLSDCSIKALVKASREGKMGLAIYDYSDFMFCKHLGKVSNNYLVTLRRFPYPPGDHINFTSHGEDENEVGDSIDDRTGANHHMPDMGRLVTWMGTPGNEMEEILKYNVLMPYEPLTSTIEHVNGSSETGGLMGTILNMTSSSYARKVQAGLTGSGTLSHLSEAMQKFGGNVGGRLASNILASPPYESLYHEDRTKAYGPVDVIAQTHMRRKPEGGGLEFNQEINLLFDYELRSFDNINTKAAFLDLLANILAVTYTNGRFWKGRYMGSGTSQSSLFTNLPIYNLDIMHASIPEITDAALGSLSMIGQALNNGKPVTGKEDWLNMIGNIARNLLGVLAGGMLNKLGRPQRQAVNSLLSDAPVGLWHLTIGNPKHPIMTMGNMILDDVTINHYGILGLDDFPTGLRVSIKLKHAMPRDAQKIEQMYMMGDYRIYHPLDDDIIRAYAGSKSANKLQSKHPQKGFIDSLMNDLSQTEALLKKGVNQAKTDIKEAYEKTAEHLASMPKTKEFIEKAGQSADTLSQKMKRATGLGISGAKRWFSGVREYTWGNSKAVKTQETKKS